MSRLAMCAAVLSSVALASNVAAQDYPSQPITIIVPASAGGPSDVLARILGDRLKESWGQTVVVENRTGANSMIGARAVAAAAPDGHRLMISNDGPITIVPHLYKDIGYDPIKSFTPITIIGWAPLVLVVTPAVPATSVKELVAHLKANPGKLNYAAGGTTTELAAELFKKLSGTSVQKVSFRGSAPSITAMLSGDIQMMVDAISSSLPFIEAGKLRALAVASSRRSAILPHLPTISEAGLPGYEASPWMGLVAPAGLPDAVRKKIRDEVARIIGLPDVKAGLMKAGFDIGGSTSEEFERTIAADLRKWAAIISELGLKGQ